jgi:hypothetical protein
MGPYTISEIWFGDEVKDVDDVDAVQYKNTSFSDDKDGFLKEACTTLVLDLTESIDDIWKGMNKNWRNQISKAQNENIIVRFNERFEDFHLMNQDFRKRRGLPASFISPEEMSRNYFLFTYERDGTLLGGHLCIKDDRSIRQLYSCSNMDQGNDVPRSVRGWANKLSIWEAIKYVKEEGLMEYDFGGYATGKLGEELKGINEFKLGFGGTVCERFSYYKSYSRSFNAGKSLYLSAVSTKGKIMAFSRRRSEKGQPERSG